MWYVLCELALVIAMPALPLVRGSRSQDYFTCNKEGQRRRGSGEKRGRGYEREGGERERIFTYRQTELQTS